MAGKGATLNLEVPVDMTPMIDIVFQLIIFLMIVVDMSQQDLEDLVLPTAEHALPDKKPKPNRPILNVTQKGKVIMKRITLFDPNKTTDRNFLRGRLRSIATHMEKKMDPNLKVKLPDENLLIRGDEFTPWFHLAKVMEDCGDKNIQIWKVQLAVAESQGSKERATAMNR